MTAADDEFDFFRDVIGDDLVVGGVVYSSAEWQLDSEDGVIRREQPPAPDEPQTPARFTIPLDDEPPF